MRFNKIIIPYFIFFIAIIMTIFNSGYEVHFSNLDGKYLIKSIEFYEFGEWSFFKRAQFTHYSYQLDFIYLA